MKKDCCDIKVTETEKGFQILIEGDDVKEKCGSMLENCKTMFENCCSSGKTEESGGSCCGPASKC